MAYLVVYSNRVVTILKDGSDIIPYVAVISILKLEGTMLTPALEGLKVKCFPSLSWTFVSYFHILKKFVAMALWSDDFLLSVLNDKLNSIFVVQNIMA